MLLFCIEANITLQYNMKVLSILYCYLSLLQLFVGVLSTLKGQHTILLYIQFP